MRVDFMAWRAKWRWRLLSRYHAAMLATTKQPAMRAPAMVWA